ncbi:TetR/AcrR family transcriptional regulator [Microlunatus parietis]|uniref:AcrR family transcriptional regulator n=1 Tax=Microlunatus parietis TaxID=682979 RepID=A0A7Y9LCQ6_9ACTN|nr:TetR/AcrR family transcriptional regulator [Microlunatus parietis]NYE71940.1 AcrR family transcriptional regulator [Microlunatus parietis]
MTDAWDRMSPERQRRLIRVAATEFAAAGYQGASLNAIIRRCGLSKSSFYYVVPGKRELYDLVIRELSADLAGRIRIPRPEELAGPAFWPELAALFDRLIAAAAEDEGSTALGRMIYGPGPDEAAGATWTGIEGWIGEALRVGRESGAVRDDLPPALQRRLVFAVLRAMDEWSLTEVEPGTDLGALARAQYDAIRRLLRDESEKFRTSP